MLAAFTKEIFTVPLLLVVRWTVAEAPAGDELQGCEECRRPKKVRAYSLSLSFSAAPTSVIAGRPLLHRATEIYFWEAAGFRSTTTAVRDSPPFRAALRFVQNHGYLAS